MALRRAVQQRGVQFGGRSSLSRLRQTVVAARCANDFRAPGSFVVAEAGPTCPIRHSFAEDELAAGVDVAQFHWFIVSAFQDLHNGGQEWSAPPFDVQRTERGGCSGADRPEHLCKRGKLDLESRVRECSL